MYKSKSLSSFPCIPNSWRSKQISVDTLHGPNLCDGFHDPTVHVTRRVTVITVIR